MITMPIGREMKETKKLRSQSARVIIPSSSGKLPGCPVYAKVTDSQIPRLPYHVPELQIRPLSHPQESPCHELNNSCPDRH